MLTKYADRFGSNQHLLDEYLIEQPPRLNELSWLVKLVDLDHNANILNIPCESSILRKLAPNWSIDYADFKASDFMKKVGVKETDTKLSCINTNFYDAIVGIVPIHHLTDDEQIDFFIAAKRTLVSGGRLVIAEPLVESNTAIFLDSLIDRHSETGHKGNYPNKDLVDKFVQVGFRNAELKTVDCGLIFSSEENMVIWFEKFFGIRSPDKKRFIAETKSLLGSQTINGQLRLGWDLTFFIGNN